MAWIFRGSDIFEDDVLYQHRHLPFLQYVKIPGSFPTLEELEKWILSEEEKQIKNAAIKLLSRRSYSRYLLSQKLKDKGFSEKTIRPIVEWASQKGYVQDEEYARALILQEIQLGKGPKMILAKLRMKGLVHMETMLQKLYPKDMQIEKVQKLIKSKNIAACLRRGFSWDTIQTALKLSGSRKTGKGDDVSDIFHAGDE
jgi:SOS response regulatory protein OraA/RecX